MADITITQTAAADVPTPASGKTAFFFTTADGSPHYKDSAGTDHALGTGATGTVSSVALAMPSLFTVTGSPITASGTLTASLATQDTNVVLCGPASGSAAAPTFRALQAADLPAMGASGSSHAAGIVPDPGATAGTTKFLCENAEYSVPPGNGNATEIQSVAVSSTAPTDGQVLTYSSSASAYQPTTPSGGGGGTLTVTTDAPADNVFAAGDNGKVFVFTGSSDTTYSLPATSASGWCVTVINNSPAWLTILPTAASGVTIDGGSSLVLKEYQGVRIFSDGTNCHTDRGLPSGNIDAYSIRGIVVNSAAPADGEVLRYNFASTSWKPTTPSAAGTASGDLSGTYPDPTVAKLQGRDFSNAAPADGQVPTWDATNSMWVPETPSSGGSGSGLTFGTLTDDGYSGLTWNTSSIQIASTTLTSNTSISLSNLTGSMCYLLVKQSSSMGGNSLTWTTGVTWLNGTNAAPDLSQMMAGGAILFTLFYDGTTLYGTYSDQNTGAPPV